MTREEQIKKQADIYTDDASNYAEWSEDGGWTETNDIELVEKAFIEGAKWADKTMIEKACEWLINIDFDGYDFRDCDESFNNDLLVDAFRRKAMEK